MLDVDAFEEVVERTLFKDDYGRIVHRLGNAEQATIHTLVKHAQTSSVEEENLQRGSSLAEEHEHRARASGAAHALLRETGEPVEAEAHIDGLERDEDLDAMRDHWAVPPSAATTERSKRASKPGQTSIRVEPITMAIEPGGGVEIDGDRGAAGLVVVFATIAVPTTRANRIGTRLAGVGRFDFRPTAERATFPSRPSRLDHVRSVPAVNVLSAQ